MTRKSDLKTSQIQSWFSALAYTEQQSVLSTLTNAHNVAKRAQIDHLRSELAALESDAPSSNATRKSKSNGANKSQKLKKKVAPKYQDRKSDLTWTGRGLQPLWVREHVKKGGTLEDLLIKAKRKSA